LETAVKFEHSLKGGPDDVDKRNQSNKMWLLNLDWIGVFVEEGEKHCGKTLIIVEVERVRAQICMNGLNQVHYLGGKVSLSKEGNSQLL
jgi:hypothetical protein